MCSGKRRTTCLENIDEWVQGWFIINNICNIIGAFIFFWSCCDVGFESLFILVCINSMKWVLRSVHIYIDTYKHIYIHTLKSTWGQAVLETVINHSWLVVHFNVVICLSNSRVPDVMLMYIYPVLSLFFFFLKHYIFFILLSVCRLWYFIYTCMLNES